MEKNRDVREMYKNIAIIVLVLVSALELWIIGNDHYLLDRTLSNSIRGIQLNIEFFLKNHDAEVKQEDFEQLYLSINRDIDTINKISKKKNRYKVYSLKYLGYAIEDMCVTESPNGKESIELLKIVCSEFKKLETVDSLNLKSRKNIEVISKINDECKK